MTHDYAVKSFTTLVVKPRGVQRLAQKYIVKEKFPNPAPATQPYYLIQSTPSKKTTI